MSNASGSDVRILFVIFGAALAILVIALAFGGPMLEGVSAVFAEGMGLKAAAVWSFFVTLAVFVLLAIVAGDGLIGELQFMLGSFFTFFGILTLLIAWVF
jgi:hypothetical protein